MILDIHYMLEINIIPLFLQTYNNHTKTCICSHKKMTIHCIEVAASVAWDGKMFNLTFIAFLSSFSKISHSFIALKFGNLRIKKYNGHFEKTRINLLSDFTIGNKNFNLSTKWDNTHSNLIKYFNIQIRRWFKQKYVYK